MKTANIDDLVERDLNELLADLGAAVLAHAALPMEANDRNARRKALSKKIQSERPHSEKSFLQRVGQALLFEIAGNLHDLVCSGTDKELKNKVEQAISSGAAALAALIHSLLIGIGIDSAISLLSSVILAKSTTAASHQIFCDELAKYKE